MNTGQVNRKPTTYTDGPGLLEGPIRTCPIWPGGIVTSSSTINAWAAFAGTFTVVFAMSCPSKSPTPTDTSIGRFDGFATAIPTRAPFR